MRGWPRSRQTLPSLPPATGLRDDELTLTGTELFETCGVIMRLALRGILLATLLGGCDRSERNVITETAPFYQTEVGYDKARIDLVIDAVRSFSHRHQMDFLLAGRSLGPGEFNASANGPSLNLRAMHSELLDRGVSVSAVARGNPTPEDKALVSEFVAKIREGAASQH